MGFKLGDVIVDRLQFGYGAKSNGTPLYALTQLTETTIDITADSVDITDKDGNLVYRKYTGMRILESTRTSAKGNLLLMSVDSGNMHNYPGWTGINLTNDGSAVGKNTLIANYAFDFMFMNGEHGHGRWMMHQSIPPYMYVEDDIYDGFGGRVNKVINKTIEKILKR